MKGWWRMRGLREVGRLFKSPFIPLCERGCYEVEGLFKSPFIPLCERGCCSKKYFFDKESFLLRKNTTTPKPPFAKGGRGDFMIPYNKKSKEKAQKLRRNMTLAEKKIWYELLRKDKLEGFRFLRQKPLDNYIADFYCAELLLVIEIDGESHLAEGAKEYDAHRTKVLNGYGIEVVRYTNEQILNHLDEVEQDLKEKVKLHRDKLSLGRKYL